VDRPEFVEEPCEFIIRSGIVIASYADGSKRAFALNVFRICVARALRALEDYDTREATIIAFPDGG
jgi:hypothetical protein